MPRSWSTGRGKLGVFDPLLGEWIAEAQLPAGTERMIYRPDGQGGFHWAVESKHKKGWNRFTEHHYRRVGPADRGVAK